ncbi:MAG: PatB family C-S lyase [Acholeplasmatales bacterium]|nr:PatB family C-S lyase [Acholeplasmatales bacterium]
MSKYNFDEIINRKNTNSLKWDFAKERGKKEGILPFWVADMDFRLTNEILNPLIDKIKEGIFGYSDPKDDYYEALISWYLKHYKINIRKENIIINSSVVSSICSLIRIASKENDAILINEPVYYPFKLSILANKRKAISSDLIIEEGKYKIDFVDFENKIKNNNIKAYILCNPHNPVGRVWDKDELEKIVSICKKYNVFIISDEIHADFCYEKEFISIANFDTNYAIVSALTKTFNIPGFKIAHAIIPNEIIYDNFKNDLDKIGYSQQSIMGLVASKTAMLYGEEWLSELKDYLWNNILYVDNYLKTYLPKIKLIKPEGTYLIRLDFNEFNLTHKRLSDLIEKANLWLDDGIIFGRSGKGYQRINIATPKVNIDLMLKSLYEVFKNL